MEQPVSVFRFTVMCTAYGCEARQRFAVEYDADECYSSFEARRDALLKAGGWRADRFGFLCTEHDSQAAGVWV